MTFVALMALTTLEVKEVERRGGDLEIEMGSSEPRARSVANVENWHRHAFRVSEL